jgi:hypothetical protein
MEALSAIEREHGFKLPQPYRAFAERGYLTHQGDVYLWVNEAEWIPPEEVITYEWMGRPKPGLVPFAFTGGGDVWAWQTQRIMSSGEPAIAFCPHDSYEGHWHAPTFIGWLYRTGLEYATVIWDEETETRKNLATWSHLVRVFGDSAWATDLDEISRRPLLKYRVGRRETEGLLHPDDLRTRVAAAFGSDFVDAPYIWDQEGDAATG